MIVTGFKTRTEEVGDRGLFQGISIGNSLDMLRKTAKSNIKIAGTTDNILKGHLLNTIPQSYRYNIPTVTSILSSLKYGFVSYFELVQTLKVYVHKASYDEVHSSRPAHFPSSVSLLHNTRCSRFSPQLFDCTAL
jgi:hypothetical protein